MDSLTLKEIFDNIEGREGGLLKICQVIFVDGPKIIIEII